MIHIIGTGVVGLTLAEQLLTAGHRIRITTANAGVDATACSWWAGGMLAPYCEMETAEPLVGKLAPISMAYWQQFCQQTGASHQQQGTLVIASNRDRRQLQQFASKTEQWQQVNKLALAKLEPLLSHHQQGLFYPSEAHIQPREVLHALWHKVRHHPQTIGIDTHTHLTDQQIFDIANTVDWLVDCRGYAAHTALTGLRGVRGEMLHLYNPEVSLSRPIRLLHPRIPVYLVPREGHEFMLGATMIESAHQQKPSVRSVMELLSAVHSISPAFLQSEIVEIGTHIRPAYADNLPKIIKHNNIFSINGMYRHGYLLAPAYAKRVADYIGKASQINQDENSPPITIQENK